MAELRSARLGVVLTLSEREEEQAATRLQQGRAVLEREQSQLLELQGYHAEYEQTIAAQRLQISVQTLVTYRHFLGELSRSVDAQALRVKQADAQCLRLMREWQQAFHRRKSIAELIERLRLEEDAHAEKQLQKLMDELTSISRRHRDAE